MKLKTLLRAIPVMLILGLLGVGALVAPVSAAVGDWTVSTLTGGPNTTVSVTGTGLTVGNTFKVFWGAVQIGSSATVITGGTATVTFAVPVVIRGNYQLTATSTNIVPALNDSLTTPSYTFSVVPTVILSQNSGVVGTTLTAQGLGFAALNAIDLYFDNTGVDVQTATTDTNGTFVTSVFAVPQLIRGSHLLTVQEHSGAAYTQASFTILSNVSSTLLTGFVGDSITVTGTGFVGGDSSTPNVVFAFDGTTLASVTSATSVDGIFTRTLVIPPTYRGSHTITASDGFGSASFSFIVSSKMTITPISGVVGTPVNVTGTGFAASNSVTFTLDSASIPGASAITTDAAGGFIKTGLIIPITTAGSHTIAVTDGAGSASATFTVTSSISLTQTTGYAGDIVSINGTGFYPAASITLAYDGAVLSSAPASVIVQTNGSFSAQFTVPGTAAGTHNVVASDGLGDVATGTFTNSIDSAISPVTSSASGSQGFVGQDVTLTGKGFKPGATITAKFDANQAGTATASASGSFSITFKAPVVTGGNHSITVTDGITTKTFTYFMDKTAPSAPTLSTPLTATKSKQPIDFTWAAVTDLSNPVTYKLEVATDANFTTLVIIKDGLTTTSYTTTDAEKLPTVSKKAPYYWRVTATDAAGNISAPSTASTFVVGFAWADVPIWVWIVGVVFVVIIAGGITYLLTRRRSRY